MILTAFFIGIALGSFAGFVDNEQSRIYGLIASILLAILSIFLSPI